MKVLNTVKAIGLSALILSASTGVNKVYSNNISRNEISIKSDKFERSIPAKGTDNPNILRNAPSPLITIAGKSKKAALVIDVDNHTLYHYDKNGNPLKAYLVATGKKGVKDKNGRIISRGTPTHEFIGVVSHIEKYPYRTAPRTTKRARTPRAFGPRAIILFKVDPQTGEQSAVGQFVHGNNNPKSLGGDYSHGCVRCDNKIIEQEIVPEIEKGMYVVFMNASEYKFM